MNRFEENESFEPMGKPKGGASGRPPEMDLAGAVLVAAPGLEDAIFGRSVCLVLEHSAEHSIGVLLNRPFAMNIHPLWQQLTAGLGKTAEPPTYLHFGGPLSGPVVAVHDNASIAEAGNGNGIYLAANLENLQKLAMVSPKHYRLCVGHSAWKAGQLEDEIRQGLWYPLPAVAEIVFADNTEMWARGLRKVGDLFIQTMCGLENVPASPEFN